MGVPGDRIFAAIKQRGFPAPWSAFGECLSWESAYAVQLKQAIDLARKGSDEQLDLDISELFARKAGNLANARKLLDDVLIEYDRSGMWQVLDERAARLDIDDLAANTRRWADAWTAETTTGVIDRVTTVECDLASEEAPMHCDICKKSITALLYLDA